MTTEEEFYNNLRRGGKWLYRHKLIFYDPLFDDIDFSWRYWYIPQRIVCFFIGHKEEKIYRFPKDKEIGDPELCGCVYAGIHCARCWRTLCKATNS